MAQGGHGWPPGQFQHNGMDHGGNAGSNDLGLAYDGIGTDSEMAYMPDWGTMNQPAGNFASQNHGSPPNQQFYQPQSYYQANHNFSQGNPAEARSSTASPAVPYGNAMFQDPAFQLPGHQQQEQQTYQQFNSVDSNQHTPPVARNFSEPSWQSQASHAAQNQYTQQTFSYGDPQTTYQQQFQPVSHSHTPTPPPGQRHAGHFAGAQVGQADAKPDAIQAGNPGIHGRSAAQVTNPAATQYQFQVNQGQIRNPPYQTTAIPAAQNAPPYQNQVRFAQPSHASGQNHFSASSPRAGVLQVTHPATSAGAHVQKPMTRTDSPAIYAHQPAVMPSSGTSYTNNQQVFAPPPTSGLMQQSPHIGYAATIIPSSPPFDPVANGGFSKLDDEASLFLSDVPIDGSDLEILPEDTFPFSAHFNAKDAALIPSRAKRLPCEIRRDWKWLRKQEKGADSDAKRRVILLEKDRLDREMVHITGERIEPSTKTSAKKFTFKSESKSASIRRTGSESSDDSSEYDSDSDYEESKEDQEARKIKTGGRPSDPVKAIEYDVINAVWRANDEAAQPNTTANAIQAYGVHIEKLWNKAKDLKKDVKTAKEKKSKKLEPLEAELTTQLKLILAAIDAATKYAEPSVLENMGGNAKLAVILWNAMRSSIATKDYNGPLPKAILFLMSHFATMGKSLVVGVLKVHEFQKKHQKEFDKVCNGYLDQIQSKAKTASDLDKKPKDTAPLNGIKETAALVKKTPTVMAKDLMSASKKPATTEPKKAQAVGATVLDVRKISGGISKSATSSPSKRPRDDDVDSRATKKVAVDGLPNPASTTKPATTSTPKTTTVVQPRPKSSGSILPGRLRPTVKPAAKKAEPSQSSSLSTISGLLAEIAKPKSPPRQKDEPTRAPETEEEKQRRIRKEARRRLRVTWKADDELEEVRIFQHDAAEDEGRASNMVRDARDNRSEGQALKRARVNESEEQDASAENEEEEDDTQDGKPKEVSIREWANPSAIDFSHIDQINSEQRRKSFNTRGGHVAFHTEDQMAMEKYEQTQVMEVYTTLSDIPETPKSPGRKESEQPAAPLHISQLPVDTPNLQELHLRWTEGAQLGPVEATSRMLQRLQHSSSPDRAAKFDRLLLELRNAAMVSQDRNQPYAFAPSVSQPSKQSHPSMASTAAVMSPVQRDAEVLRLLSSTKVQNWADPDQVKLDNPSTQRRFDYGDPRIQADIDAVESAAAGFIGKPYPAAEPPEHMKHNLGFVKEWQLGHSKDMAEKATQDATERAKKLAAEFSRKNVTAAMQPAPVPAASQAAQDPQAAAWAAYFAQMGQNQPQLQQAQSAQGQQLTQDQYAAILQQAQALQAQQGGHGLQTHTPRPLQQQPTQQDPNGHIGALLAALGGQVAQPQIAAPTQQLVQDSSSANAAAWAAYYASLGQAQPQPAVSQQSQTQQKSYKHRDHDRDRSNRNNHSAGDGMLDYGPSETESHDKNNRVRKENIKDSFRRKEYDGKGINRSLIGTKPCTFWAQGKCAKGDQCTFRHDPNDLVN